MNSHNLSKDCSLITFVYQQFVCFKCGGKWESYLLTSFFWQQLQCL